MSFTQFKLHPSISKALTTCGYTTPTPIQAQAIPVILQHKDLVAAAQTGTGKTAAFILPALQRLALAKPKRQPRVLVLTPTRELANQISVEAKKFGKFLNLQLVNIVGGVAYQQQFKMLAKPHDIIVATPGRLMDHMQNKKIDLSAIEMLILDEADRMLDMGFIQDVKRIAHAIPQQKQTLLFSATIDDRLNKIITSLLKKPVQIDLAKEALSPKLIDQVFYMADDNKHKRQLLRHYLTEKNMFKAIIFSATKHNADRLADDLYAEGFEVAALHGDHKQNKRNRTIEKFKTGKVQFLIATDVAARGIDISDVTHVINFDLPKFPEDYVHRIGRTGRAGKTGQAVSFVLHIEAAQLKKISRFINLPTPLQTIKGLEPKQTHASAHAHPKKPKFNSHNPRRRHPPAKRKSRTN